MNMIASVLHLDRRSVKDLRMTDAYSLHRIVYSLFDDIRDDQEKQASHASGILYADQGGDYKARKILMLSNRQPMSMVEGQFGEVQSKPISPSFLSHEHYRFKVVINPCRRESVSRKLIPVRGKESVAQWVRERALASWGFEASPKHLQVNKIDVLQFTAKAQRQVTVAQAHVQGLLHVTDRERFIKSFENGIGRARAFGCGLLQIVPLIDNPFA